MKGDKVDICDISRSVFDQGHLSGIVSLRWPYSSSQHSITLQLADEDIRRRGDRGQVRLTFNGKAADSLRDIPSLTLLKVHAEPNAVRIEDHKGSKRDSSYKITFIGQVVVSQNGVESALDSVPLENTITPAKIRRTWQMPDLKRSAPDELGLEDSWFSQDTPDSKRKKYSDIKLIDSTPSSNGARLSSIFKTEKFQFQTPTAPARIERFEPDDEAEVVVTQVEEASQPSSAQGDVEDTPRSGPQANPHLSAPPTPRNVPYLSLESADEQEDLFRKLRASAPPKSDAGSSMVADEDDEAGNLADDPNPTILEKQSRIQEGILRRKISDDTAGGINLNPDTIDGSLVELQPSEPAAVAEPAPDRTRAISPSMTERGAAVQESVFRSKIKAETDEDIESVKSVKSSVLVEPAAASIDGSVLENVERTMLDQQASVQETLFRDKLDAPVIPSSLSLIGPPASSTKGDEVVNAEPSMLEQQADIQETIFRDKVGNTQEPSHPASLEHMEVRGTSTLPPDVALTSHSTATRTVEEFHERADIENAIGAAVGDETAEAEAREFLEMELEAEPEGQLDDFHEFGDEYSDDVADDTNLALHGSSPAEPIEIESDIEADEISQMLDDHDRRVSISEADMNDDHEIDEDEMYHDENDEAPRVISDDESEVPEFDIEVEELDVELDDVDPDLDGEVEEPADDENVDVEVEVGYESADVESMSEEPEESMHEEEAEDGEPAEKTVDEQSTTGDTANPPVATISPPSDLQSEV